MKYLVAASFAALACLFAQAALAEDEEPAVPIEKAPFHQPVFKNEFWLWIPGSPLRGASE